MRPEHVPPSVEMAPDEWEPQTLGDLERKGQVRLGRGQVISQVDINEFPGDYPIYSSSIHDDGLFGRYASYMFDEELITWSIDGGGNFFYRPKHRFSVTNVCGYMRINTTTIDYRFLAYQLQLLHEAKTYDYQMKAHPSVIRWAYTVALPGIDEQKRIASALSDVDALISSLDKLIAKKRDIKQAAMQQLLTGRRRLPGFSGRWEERRLEDVAALDSENLGGDTPRDYEFNYVSLEDVNRGILRGYANQLFSSAPSRARRVIRSGDVLVSTVRPNLGSHLLFKSSSPDWICSTGFSVVRCVEDAACPGYVFYHLFGDYVTRQIDAQLTGSSYPAISSKDVGNLRMPFPSIDEQRAIASVLSDMDAEIEALERRRDKTRLLKQGMMQELLTGRVRLV